MSSYSRTGQGVGRRALLAGATMLPFPAIRAHAQTAGVALVIGNSRYQWEAPLPNVRRDAPDIAQRLQALGIKTDLVQDAGRDAMRRAIDAFTAASRGANFAAFYFAGHGAAWGRETYLVPLDADLSTPNVVGNLVPVASVSSGIASASHRLMVFDNCRNNPSDGWRQREAEQAALVKDVPGGGAPNTLTLYSTAPGRVALDGPAGDNSPFAATLLRQLSGQSVDLQGLPARLRRDLLVATQGRQVVWDHNTYSSPFLLKGPPGKAAVAGRSGWGQDPSRIIELNGAYVFAQQNGLPLPAGLIAHRPPGNLPHREKVGAFKFDSPVPGGGIEPCLMVVISIEEQEGAELMLVLRVRGVGGWRFVRTKITGDTLDYVPSDRGVRFVFKWSDANSGSVSVFPPSRGSRNTAAFNGRFTRLDG